MFKKTTELIENHQQDKTYIFVFTLMQTGIAKFLSKLSICPKSGFFFGISGMSLLSTNGALRWCKYQKNP